MMLTHLLVSPTAKILPASTIVKANCITMQYLERDSCLTAPLLYKSQSCNHCKRVNNKFKKSYDLPVDILQCRRENSAEYL